MPRPSAKSLPVYCECEWLNDMFARLIRRRCMVLLATLRLTFSNSAYVRSHCMAFAGTCREHLMAPMGGVAKGAERADSNVGDNDKNMADDGKKTG